LVTILKKALNELCINIRNRLVENDELMVYTFSEVVVFLTVAVFTETESPEAGLALPHYVDYRIHSTALALVTNMHSLLPQPLFVLREASECVT
jgi:hypothetical protein